MLLIVVIAKKQQKISWVFHSRINSSISMGSLFSLKHDQPEFFEDFQPINQYYNVEFGYAPVSPIGPVYSVPKRNLYASGPSHRHLQRY
ncbi:unnamed protein product [Rotaria magnacalcarata]|uniref:Uncharacterized protein n=2 Tax=Rotaria magnacalcarata TaxID=392030 RepID=A0A819CDG8_9BILA|nr:unnamed protein product [Rotaria magnacalcarata]